jgi:hypothetical protein
MADFEVAHLKIQGVDVVIIFLGREFDHKAESEQAQIHQSLQVCSAQAGLRGNVVLIWEDVFGRPKFRAPQNQRAFFKTVNVAELYAQRNKRLTCN